MHVTWQTLQSYILLDMFHNLDMHLGWHLSRCHCWHKTQNWSHILFNLVTKPLSFSVFDYLSVLLIFCCCYKQL